MIDRYDSTLPWGVTLDLIGPEWQWVGDRNVRKVLYIIDEEVTLE